MLIGVVGLLTISSCEAVRGPVATTTTVSASPPATTTTVQPAWTWGVEEVDLGRGYRLGPCEGDADQIACITKDGSIIGSAEAIVFPVESFDVIDGVDDPVESIELIAADYVSTFASDRQSSCPDLEFREIPSTQTTIGGLPGLRYGFQELDDSRVVEANVVYGVREDNTISLFNFAAIAEGACLGNEGELPDPAILDARLPVLDRAMASVESG